MESLKREKQPKQIKEHYTTTNHKNNTMHADLAGALEQLDDSWKAFTHNGKPMSKQQVRAALIYGIRKGYKSTKELTDADMDFIMFSGRPKTPEKEGPTLRTIPEQRYKSCLGCKYYDRGMMVFGRHPEYESFCEHVDARGSNMLVYGTLPNADRTPDWCPFIKDPKTT